MKKGALLFLLLLLCLPAAVAFEVEVSPREIYTELQAGGYVSELVELHTDRPVQVIAKASPSINGLVRISRHNETGVIVHFLPPHDTPEATVTGTLVLDAIGKNPALSAGLQHAEIPLNITIVIRGKAEVPAAVDLSRQQEIKIVPLSADSITLLAVAIAGIVAMNVMLRGKRKR